MAFKDIVGQPHALTLIQRSIRNKRLAHAYLFAGAEGVGKTSCAISLAQALNCEKERDYGCGECVMCQKIARMSSPDFTKIEPGGPGRLITIDDIRALRREIYFQPVEGKYKIFLLVEADRMNEESSNALLKVLEEPPEKSLLILTSSRPELLLPTIISRCQLILFGRLKTEEVVRFLLESSDVGETEAKSIASLSEGSPGKALSFIREGLDERSNVISLLQQDKLSDIENVLSLAEDRAARLGLSSAEHRKKLLTFLLTVLSWYRDIFIVALGGTQILNEDYVREVKESKRRFSAVELQKALKMILQAQRWIELNANPRLVLEVLFLRLRALGA